MANKSATSWQQVVVMEFGKRHNITDTTDFCLRQLVTDLSFCCGFVVDLLRGSRQLVTALLRGTGVMDFGLKLTRQTSRGSI